jgi:(p)ppGpp synthase/HD superfamily hydrolase
MVQREIGTMSEMSEQSFLERFPQHRDDVAFIQTGHAGQKRHQGTPYYLHPIATSEIGETVARAEGLPYDDKLRRAFLKHDVKEDNPKYTWEEVDADPEVVSWIKPVTKVKPENWKTLDHTGKLAWTIEHYRALRLAPAQSRVIKIADRIHNLSEMENATFWFRQNYVLDTALLIGALRDYVKPETISLLEDTYWKAVVAVVA